jgi:hypothetical protein
MTASFRIRTNEAAPWIEARRSFKTSGALGGLAFEPPVPGTQFWGGQLPQAWRERLAKQSVDYVVFSYVTPIAWHHAKGWEFPDERYSQTTSTHQGQVRRANIKETTL